MGDDGKEAHCPGSALSNAASAVPLPAVAGWVVVGVCNVSRVSVVGEDNVSWDAGFDGNWVDLLPGDTVKALR